jgi:hypothetical protein
VKGHGALKPVPNGMLGSGHTELAAELFTKNQSAVREMWVIWEVTRQTRGLVRTGRQTLQTR